MRYNVLYDEIQVKTGDRVMALVPSKIKAVRLGDKVFSPMPFLKEDGTVGLGYFEVLEDGMLFLLRKILL